MTTSVTPRPMSTRVTDDRPPVTQTQALVSTPHPNYERMRARWEKCRALMGGTQAIRDGAETYLPRLEQETDDSYEFRQQLVALFNGFERTVYACVGLIHEEDPELGDDMPARLKALAEDVDLKGTHLDVYAKRLALDALIDGFAGTLVDYPKVDNPQAVSIADEQRAGYRPYFVAFTARDILKVVFGFINGIKVLTLVVLREVTEEQYGDFGVIDIVRYRVFRRTLASVTWEVWKEAVPSQSGGDSTGGVASVETTATPMRGTHGIPFSLFVAGQKLGDFNFRPPLENLADLNIEHYQVKTNIRHIEMLAMVPTQVRIGAVPNDKGEYPPIRLGSRVAIEAPATQGVPKPIYWHSPDISVLEPGNRSLADIKSDMGTAGMQFLTPDTRRAETAQAKRIDAVAQNASISSVSRNEQDHLEEVFGFAGDYLGEKAGSITMNRDFENLVMDAQMVTALGGLAANGKLSIDTLLMLLEKGRIIPDGFDREAEVKRLLTENAPPPSAPLSATDPTPDTNAPPLPDSQPPTAPPTAPPIAA